MPNHGSQAVSRTEPNKEATPAPCRLIRLPEVMERVGISRSAIYQRMAEGTFPRSRSLGSRCAVWIETEIEDWIEEIKRL